MDHRCPICKANLGRRKLSQTIVARMEIDCPHCNGRLQLNVHRAETIVVLLSFGTIVVLAALAYWMQSQRLMLFAFGAVMAGAAALPLVEHVYLRTWPRYVPQVQRPGS